jgi:hypothetical protein
LRDGLSICSISLNQRSRQSQLFVLALSDSLHWQSQPRPRDYDRGVTPICLDNLLLLGQIKPSLKLRAQTINNRIAAS